MSDLEDRLKTIVRADPGLMQVMTTVRGLGLNDWRIFSGAVYQSVWNAVTGRAAGYGIKDYDLGYFDPDTSWDAEDAVIRKVAGAFEPPLREMVEVRNQARVHLWFEGRFGEPYEALTGTDEALGRFVAPALRWVCGWSRTGRSAWPRRSGWRTCSRWCCGPIPTGRRRRGGRRRSTTPARAGRRFA